MIADGDELEALTRGGPLEAYEVYEEDQRGSSDLLLVMEISPRDLLDVWRAAYALLPVTGRWPIATTTWGSDEIRARAPRRLPAPERAVDLLARRRRRRQRFIVEEDQWPGWLEETRRLCGSAPEPAEFEEAWAQDPSPEALDRWLLAWEERHAPTAEPCPADYLDWFVPDEEADGCLLCFAPTSVPAEAAGMFFFFGAGDDADDFPAVLHSWWERFGAAPIAHWGTMMQFVVERPPQTLDEAWVLAAEQWAMAYDTFGSPPAPLREAARALWRRPTWVLRDRP